MGKSLREGNAPTMPALTILKNRIILNGHFDFDET